MTNTYFSIHNHSHFSNLRLIDSINLPNELLSYAVESGLSGISLSDHETLSGHVKFLEAYDAMKEEGKIPDNFKIGFGNEIYVVREESLEELQENYHNRNPETMFYHFLLTAINKEGYQQLRELSSLAWKNSFNTGFMTRTPTFKHDLKRIIKGGHVIGTSACLGGELPQYILRRRQSLEKGEDSSYYDEQISEYMDFFIGVFGKDKFFLEMQPSENEEQHYVNRELIKLSERYNLRYIIATDSHYLKKEDREAHKVYLQSQQGDREVDAFYDSTYIFQPEEIKEAMLGNLTEEEIETGMSNTMLIHEMIEPFDIRHKVIIPHVDIESFTLNHLFQPAYEQYPFIKNYAESPHEVDNYLLFLIEEGFKKIMYKPDMTREEFHIILDRINTELRELWLISEKLGDRMSSYYVLVRQVVDYMWHDAESFVGVARGSAAGFLINYLIEITQINPLQYDLPHFRHLTVERPELPDIDLDSEQSKRGAILNVLKEKFGEDRVLNIATFSREGARSALLSASRGMGIPVDESQHLTNLLPTERGKVWSLEDAFFGNEKKNRKPVRELVEAVEKYEGLKEISLKIEGLIKNNSIHAAGIYIFNDSYVTQNAMMKASGGVETTQFDMGDSDAQGALKIDALTVQNMDKLHVTMDMLIEDGYMEWQGNLKDTYNKYLHPDVLDYTDEDMWAMVGDNAIPDLFQFDTSVCKSGF